MKKLFSQSDKQHNGFVLLFALVVSAIIFFIGAGIFSISFKELMVSSISKESQKSIFAADSGVECGLWADTNDLIDTPFNCFDLEDTKVFNSGWRSFDIYYKDSKTCAHVFVSDTPKQRYKDVIEKVSEQKYGIISNGYNKCDPETGKPIRSYAGLTERVYKVFYFR